MDLYGGRLFRLYHLSSYDVGVYVFLLTRKWYTAEWKFSKNGITNELNSIPSHFVPADYRKKYDPRKVESSLIKLTNYGFVIKCKNNLEKKLGHRNPDFIYESKDITVLQPEMKNAIDITRDETLRLLSEVGNVEEDALTYKNQLEKNNGK